MRSRSDLAERIARAKSASLGKYNTTINDCNCPHRHFRGAVCKHMIALRTLTGVTDAASSSTPAS